MIELFKYLKEKDNREIPLVIRIKYNIDLYYKNKSKIEDEYVLEILDKAYNWLYEFLTDDLNNLDKRKVESKYYDYVYYKDDKPILAYNDKDNINDIHYENFYSLFESYMVDYITEYKILILIIHKYLVNTLQMGGHRTFHQYILCHQ